jgi:hypothetical protein
MNWWLIGLSASVLLLWLRQLGSVHRWNSLVKTLAAFTEMIGAMGGVSQEKIEEGRKVWTEARINAEKQLATTSVLVFGFIIFLIALMVRGKI